MSGPSTQPSSSNSHLPHWSPGQLPVLPAPASPSGSLLGAGASPYLTLPEAVLAISEPNLCVSQTQKGEEPAVLSQDPSTGTMTPGHSAHPSHPLSPRSCPSTCVLGSVKASPSQTGAGGPETIALEMTRYEKVPGLSQGFSQVPESTPLYRGWVWADRQAWWRQC